MCIFKLSLEAVGVYYTFELIFADLCCIVIYITVNNALSVCSPFFLNNIWVTFALQFSFSFFINMCLISVIILFFSLSVFRLHLFIFLSLWAIFVCKSSQNHLILKCLIAKLEDSILNCFFCLFFSVGLNKHHMKISFLSF